MRDDDLVFEAFDGSDHDEDTEASPEDREIIELLRGEAARFPDPSDDPEAVRRFVRRLVQKVESEGWENAGGGKLVPGRVGHQGAQPKRGFQSPGERGPSGPCCGREKPKDPDSPLSETASGRGQQKIRPAEPQPGDTRFPARRWVRVPCVTIFLVLLGLIPFALTSTRDAQRTAGRNNLKQIGVAAHAFHSTNGRLPPGYLGPLTITKPLRGDYPDGQSVGALAHLLPHLEQEDYTGGSRTNFVLYDSHGRLTDIADGRSNTIMFGEFLGDGRIPSANLPPGFICVGKTNYVGVNGCHDSAIQVCWEYAVGQPAVHDTAVLAGSLSGAWSDDLGFGSHHSGAMNMLMCDGSVCRFPYGLPHLSIFIARNHGREVELPGDW